MRRALLTAAVLAVALAPAAGRADEPPTRNCTAIGCLSGVGVKMQDLSALAGAARVRVCVDGICRKTPVRQSVLVADKRLSGDARASVGVTVYDRAGRTQLRLTRRVGLRASTPNGPDCPPVCWGRTLRVDLAAHLLRVVD